MVQSTTGLVLEITKELNKSREKHIKLANMLECQGHGYEKEYNFILGVIEGFSMAMETVANIATKE